MKCKNTSQEIIYPTIHIRDIKSIFWAAYVLTAAWTRWPVGRLTDCQAINTHMCFEMKFLWKSPLVTKKHAQFHRPTQSFSCSKMKETKRYFRMASIHSHCTLKAKKSKRGGNVDYNWQSPLTKSGFPALNIAAAATSSMCCPLSYHCLPPRHGTARHRVSQASRSAFLLKICSAQDMARNLKCLLLVKTEDSMDGRILLEVEPTQIWF